MQLRPIVFGLILILCLFPISRATAQQESTSILMNIIPSNPNPGEDVSITLSSYAENLDIATITWFVDGKNALSGVGEKSFLLKAPNLGSETKVTAKIKMAYEETQVSTTISPSQMVLLWQATDSYVPPFYKGKALPAPDSFIKVVAMPEIKIGSLQIDPKKLTYVWQRDFSNIPTGSGYGKNYFIFKNDYLKSSDNIKVIAYTTDQKYSSEKSIYIQPFEPFINFYTKNIDLGILWENSLSNNYFINESDIIVAEPYFISPKDIRKPELEFSWRINNNSVSINEDERNILPISVEEGTSGSSKIKLEIDNIQKLLRTISKEINISF